MAALDIVARNNPELVATIKEERAKFDVGVEEGS